MTSFQQPGQPVRVAIRHVAIRAASGIEARRIADGLGRALERALRSELTGDAGRGAPRPRRPVDRAAHELAAVIAARVQDRDR